MMMFGKKETDFIERLQNLDCSQICFPYPSKEAESILETIHNTTLWNSHWIDSSRKQDKPPDFYSDKFRIMMEVMRVNDCEHKGKKGKLYNLSMTHERKMFKELEQSGILKHFPNGKVYLNGDAQLPTYEDHNYDLYLKCFCRVISNHIASIPLYKKNHPDYKVIFLVYDESSAYFESEQIIDTKKQMREGYRMSGRPHLHFIDKAFLEVFYDKGIDYLFWYTPYKLFEHINPPLVLPTLCVYDLATKKLPSETYTYDRNKMSSVEI